MATPKDQLKERIDRDISVPPSLTSDQELRKQKVRYWCRQLAHDLIDRMNPSRELSMALTHIEEAMLIACAGIDRESESSPR